jgi:hypothetical protein
MTKEELAKQLNGREYGSETTRTDINHARAHGLVIVYGASDDLMELEGAIEDEGGCYEGGEFLIDSEGLLPDRDDIDLDDDDELEEWVTRRKKAKKLTAVRFGEGQPAWSYETDIPHATFDIKEDGEVYCRGIVFSVDSIK